MSGKQIRFGYSKVFCNEYFVGAEISANLNSNNARFASGAATTAFTEKLSINNHFDLQFVPGLLLADKTELYGKIGLAYAQIASKLSSPAGYLPISQNTNQTQYRPGFTFGVGLKRFVNRHFAVFTEYNYYDFSNLSLANFENFTATYNHSVKVYSQSLLLGASYYF